MGRPPNAKHQIPLDNNAAGETHVSFRPIYDIEIERSNASRAMARPTQPDLFGTDSQPELFDADTAPPAYRPDPDQVRARLHRILAEARAAERLPWDVDKVLLYQTIFPHMTGWLPEEEGAQLRFEFDTEMARLKAA
jgi:hypothetical protein